MESQTDPIKANRMLKTVCLIFGLISMGLYLELAGPTLPDLKDKLDINYEEISRALVARSIGYFVGSLTSGILADRFPRHIELYLSFALFMGALGTSVVPWCQQLWVTGIMFCFQGLGEGFIDINSGVLCFRLWEEKAPPYIHATHLGYGIGALIAPQIARPFLAPRDTNSSNSTIGFMTNTSFSHRTYNLNSRLEIPYSISGAISLLSSMIFLGFYIKTLKKKPVSPRKNVKQVKLRQVLNPASCADGKAAFGCIFVSLMFIYYANVVGGERCHSKFLFAYAIEGAHKLSNDNAVLLNTLYWVCFSAGRAVTTVVSKFCPIKILLPIELILNITVAIVLGTIGYKFVMILWIFFPLAGFALAPLFPGGISWINRYINVTGVVLSLVSVGSSVGGMIFHWLSGYMFEYHGPQSLMYIIIGFPTLICIVFLIMQLLGHRHGDRYTKAKNRISHEEETENMPMSVNDQEHKSIQ